VEVTAGAGVDGTCEDEATGAGTAFGFKILAGKWQTGAITRSTNLCDHADNEALLFNLVRLNRVGILKDLA